MSMRGFGQSSSLGISTSINRHGCVCSYVLPASCFPSIPTLPQDSMWWPLLVLLLQTSSFTILQGRISDVSPDQDMYCHSRWCSQKGWLNLEQEGDFQLCVYDMFVVIVKKTESRIIWWWTSYHSTGHSLFPDSGCFVTNLFKFLLLLLLHHDGLCLELWAKINVFSIKLLLCKYFITAIEYQVYIKI